MYVYIGVCVCMCAMCVWVRALMYIWVCVCECACGCECVCVSDGVLVSKRTGLGASMRACRVFFTPARPQQDTEKSRLVFQFFDDVAFQNFSVV